MMQKRINRLKTKLFLVAILLLLLGPLGVALVNRQVDDRFQPARLPQVSEDETVSTAACIPVVDDEILEGIVADIDVPRNSSNMATLYLADQAARQLPIEIDPQQLDEDDRKRRIESLALIESGEIHSPRDFVYAAFIFQHGDCPQHYRFANHLAQIALDAGYDDARWIYAATLDRYRVSLGELQKFGTQYIWIDGEFVLYPVDPTTTDEERAAYDVPSLSEAMDRSPAGSGGEFVQKRRLASWWLTLIGASFAVLGMLIAVIDPRVNAPLGWMGVAVALMVYILSAWGHYAQVISPDVQESSGGIWNVVNAVMIVTWLIFLALELVHVSRNQTDILADMMKGA